MVVKENVQVITKCRYHKFMKIYYNTEKVLSLKLCQYAIKDNQ